METIQVRFHFNGSFVHSHDDLRYIGGVEGMSCIERDLISLPEIRGHFKVDHCKEVENKRFHWCLPGEKLKTGIVLLHDDKLCKQMETCTGDGDVADIYVEEEAHVQGCTQEETVTGVVHIATSSVVCSKQSEEMEKELTQAKAYYRSSKPNRVRKTDKGKNMMVEENNESDDDSTDSEYVPQDESASEDDAEVVAIEARYKEYRKKMSAGRLEHLDEIMYDGVAVGTSNQVGEELGSDGTICSDSDFNDSYDEIDGQLVRRQSRYPRFNEHSEIPQFTLGLKFDAKQDFKQAIIKYGVLCHKVIDFIKDEGDRVRAKCNWSTCPWVCLLALNKRSNSWQITSFNMCESFNKWIIEARFLPILSLLEAIRRKVMVRIQEQRTKCERWNTVICPNINKKLNTYIKLSTDCSAISNGNNEFEVQHFRNGYKVDLNARTCTCRYWELAGLPCIHAIVCIHHSTNSLDDYVADCYRVSEFRRIYAHCLRPCKGSTAWPKADAPKPIAPGYVKLPGTPKRERKREVHEKPKATRVSKIGSVNHCSQCKGTGHNKTTCKENPTNKAPAQGEASCHAPTSQQHLSNNPAGKSKRKGTADAPRSHPAPTNITIQAQNITSAVTNANSTQASAKVRLQEPASKRTKLPALCLEE